MPMVCGVDVIDRQTPRSDTEEFDSPSHRTAGLMLLISAGGGSIGWIVAAVLAPSSARLPILAVGLVATVVAFWYVVRSVRSLAYRARVTPSGLALEYPVAAPQQ